MQGSRQIFCTGHCYINLIKVTISPRSKRQFFLVKYQDYNCAPMQQSVSQCKAIFVNSPVQTSKIIMGSKTGVMQLITRKVGDWRAWKLKILLLKSIPIYSETSIDTVLPHIVSAETILSWIWKLQPIQIVAVIFQCFT